MLLLLLSDGSLLAYQAYQTALGALSFARLNLDCLEYSHSWPADEQADPSVR